MRRRRSATPRGSRPPSDRQIANQGGGQPGPAKRLQAVPHAGGELGASGLPECVSARLRGQVGQVILSLVQNLKWIAQAGYLFKETVSLGREVPRADLSGRWRRTAFESDGPVVLLHICPETLGFSWPCPQASGHGHDAPGAQKLIGLAAAALFNPLRRRVQRAVDRRFNRARYDADKTLAVFAARLKDAVDLDSVRDDLAGAVQQALEPAHISVWMSERG